MSESQTQTWDDRRIGEEAYKEFHLYADHECPDGVHVKLRCTPTIYCADLMRKMRDEMQAEIDSLRAQLAEAQEWMPLEDGVIKGQNDEKLVVSPNGEWVMDDGSAGGEYGPQIYPDSPDGKLIAAAPDLLEACESAHSTLLLLLGAEFDQSDALTKLRNAIRKARGQETPNGHQ